MKFLGAVTKILENGLRETSQGERVAAQCDIGDKVYLDRLRNALVAKKGEDDPYKAKAEKPKKETNDANTLV